jgi:hypothetical protein
MFQVNLDNANISSPLNVPSSYRLFKVNPIECLRISSSLKAIVKMNVQVDRGQRKIVPLLIFKVRLRQPIKYLASHPC